MSQEIIELLDKAVEANAADRFRRGNLIVLPASGNLVISGDLHGHRRNFERIVAFADLAKNPGRHVILQEIIHGGPEDAEGGCLSYRLLLEAVRYKLKFPDRVHIIMGNHDTAFISNIVVLKNDKEMNRAMQLALNNEFAERSIDVSQAIVRFLFSQPLAVRCDNRVWLSHSLPADRLVDKFDTAVLSRPLKNTDLMRPGSVYILTWGRQHSQALLDRMAKLFDVDIFILGHQPQLQGWSKAGDNLIILASDHNQGCLLSIELSKSYTIDELAEAIVPMAYIA